MVQNAALSEKLKALFAHRIGNIASALEEPAQTFFGGANRLMGDDEVIDLTHEFTGLVTTLLGSKNPTDQKSPAFQALEMFFGGLSQRMLTRGGRVEDVVRYAQKLELALIDALDKDSGIPFTQSRSVLLYFNTVFNELIMAVFRVYLEEKERTLRAQEAELRETATPITEIWDGVLTLPIIGTLDSSRTMLVMEALLNRIANDRATAVVMDLTGVKSIDSQVSHHLIQVVRAVQLMGATAIVTGIRPEIARALTSLNIDLSSVTTRATLSDGLKEAFLRLGVQVSHKGG